MQLELYFSQTYTNPQLNMFEYISAHENIHDSFQELDIPSENRI